MGVELILRTAEDQTTLYDYENHRFFDALACVFNFQEPCAALIFKHDKEEFLLSYNTQCSSATKNKIREISKLIFQANGPQGKIITRKLLALYLTFNPEFKLTLKYCIKNNWFPNIQTHGLINKLLELIDNTSDYLDTYYYDSHKMQKQFISSLERDKSDGTGLDELTKINSLYQSFKNKSQQKDTKLSDILGLYDHIFDLLKDLRFLELRSKETVVIDKELIKTFIRPKQDVLKTIYWFKKYQPDKCPKITILSNINKLHAEINVAKHFLAKVFYEKF